MQRLRNAIQTVISKIEDWIEAEEDAILFDDQPIGWSDKELDGLRKAVKK